MTDTAVREQQAAGTSSRTPMNLRVIKRIGFYLLQAVIAVYLVFPFYWAVMSSFKTENQLAMTPATYIPRSPETGAISFFMGNYEQVMNSDSFRRSIVNSIIVATSVTILALAIGSFAAFALGKLRFRGKTLSLYAILSMTMFPQIAILTGLYAIIRSLGLEPLTSMILTYLLFSLPFTVWVLTAFFRALPADLMQAAQVDGATAVPNVPAGSPSAHGSGARDHGSAGVRRCMERVPVRSHLHDDQTLGSDDPGGDRAVSG